MTQGRIAPEFVETPVAGKTISNPAVRRCDQW
jgi:hypothetical protein